MSSEFATFKLTIQTPGNFDAAVDALTDGGGDYYGDYATLFRTGSVTTNLFEDITREKWATILACTGYTGTLECAPEHTQPWTVAFDGAAWRWFIDGAFATGRGRNSVKGHADGTVTVHAKDPVPFWVIKAVVQAAIDNANNND